MIFSNFSPSLGGAIDRERFIEDEYNELNCESCGREYNLYKTNDGTILCKECLAEWCIENEIIKEV